jgi:Leucine-rich repeat (LRR) protein
MMHIFFPCLAEPAAAPGPGTTIHIYGSSVSISDGVLDTGGIAISDTSELKEKLKLSPDIKKVMLTGCGLTLAQMKDLRISFPKIDFIWSVSIYNLILNSGDAFIDLGRKRITNVEEFKDFLDCFPSLTKVDMYNSWLKRAQLDELYNRYPNIRFGWTLHIFEHTVRTDVTAFSTLHNNRCPTHSSEAFEQLKYCRDLVALDLGHNCIQDISFLRNFPKLKVLILACNYITDVSVLAELKDLEYVELFKNRITDISPMANHEKLLDLNICFNKITDVSMLSTNTNLERLWIYHNKLTDEQNLAMRKALPNCKVDFKSYSTLGGWREHPRFFALHEFFRSRVFKPFDKAK